MLRRAASVTASITAQPERRRVTAHVRYTARSYCQGTVTPTKPDPTVKLLPMYVHDATTDSRVSDQSSAS